MNKSPSAMMIESGEKKKSLTKINLRLTSDFSFKE